METGSGRRGRRIDSLSADWPQFNENNGPGTICQGAVNNKGPFAGLLNPSGIPAASSVILQVREQLLQRRLQGLLVRGDGGAVGRQLVLGRDHPGARLAPVHQSENEKDGRSVRRYF